MFKHRGNHIDLVTLIAVLILMVIGIGVVYSASSTIAQEKFGKSEAFLQRHIAKVVVSLIAMFLIMKLDYHRYARVSKLGLIVALGLLAATLTLGGEIKGASRWLRFGGFGFQPSDFAKFALIIHLCVLISEKKERIQDFTCSVKKIISPPSGRKCYEWEKGKRSERKPNKKSFFIHNTILL